MALESKFENRRVTLNRRPKGEPKQEDFKIVIGEAPQPGVGQVLLRTVFLSLDPYMRSKMNAAKSYTKSLEIGEVMFGETVSKVVISNHPNFKVHDYVISYSGWQDYAVMDAAQIRKIDPSIAPLSTNLGVLGMPGRTAYAGLLDIGRPVAGETLVVAAATGPVGSAVGQIAKMKSCRVVGVAGGEKKCRTLIDYFGFDAAVDHYSPDFANQLKAACPKGIDIYFENVGGVIFQTVVPLLNDFARIPVCGLVSQYNSKNLTNGPAQMAQFLSTLLTRRLFMKGFISGDYRSKFPEFSTEMNQWIKEGRVKYLEDIVDGLENAPEAMNRLFHGKNFGKLIIKVSDI